LVIEDNDTTRLLITTFLAEDGYEVIEAADGVSALLLADNNPPDLAVVDLHLPDIGGLEIASLFYQRLPFLVLTMDAGEEPVRKCIDLGALGYILKPPDAAGFLRQIRIALERGQENLNLRRALQETQIISKALGILMVYHGLSDTMAYKSLLFRSTSQKRRMADVAGEVHRAFCTLNKLEEGTLSAPNKAIESAIATLDSFNTTASG
jgi:response regulator NasT